MSGADLLLLPLVVLGFQLAEPDGGATAIRVTLDAPPDCATAESFYTGVRARTERVRLARESEESVEIGVTVQRAGSTVQGELRIAGEDGASDTRRVDGASCEEVVEALSLTAALALDPTARLIAAPATPPVVTTVPPAAEASSPEASPPPPADRSEPRSYELELGIHGVAAEFVSPYVGFGGALLGRLLLSPDGIGASFGLGFVHLRNDFFLTPQYALFRYTGFIASACPTRLHAGVLTLEPCGLAMAGWVGGAGRNFTHAQSALRTYSSLGGALIARAPAGPGLTCELTLGASIPLARREFVASEPPRVLGETPEISALAALGLAWAF